MRKLMLVIPIFLLLLSSPAHAESKWFSWDDTNTKLHVLTTIVMFIDMKQTEYNVDNYYKYGGHGKNGEYHEENNPYLGKFPTKQELREGVLLANITTAAIAFILPPRASYVFQGSIVSIEIYCIENNYALGAKIEF